MAKYVDKNLGAGEVVLERATKSGAALALRWLFGIFFCWLLLIPFFKAISASIRYSHTELVITNKRVMGRGGGLSTTTMDFVLGKVYGVSVYHSFFGRMFNYGTLEITSASDCFVFEFIKNSDAFKNSICAQQEKAEESKRDQQAEAVKNAVNEAAVTAVPVQVQAQPIPAVAPAQAQAQPKPAAKPAPAQGQPKPAQAQAKPGPAAKPAQPQAQPKPAAKSDDGGFNEPV